MFRHIFVLSSTGLIAVIFALLRGPTSVDSGILSLTVGQLEEHKCCIRTSRPGCACQTAYHCTPTPPVCNGDDDEIKIKCLNAQCVSLPSTLDTCGKVEKIRGINSCQTTGTYEACPPPHAACPANMNGYFRCKFTQTDYDDPDAHTDRVYVCATGSTLCSTGQPTSVCD